MKPTWKPLLLAVALALSSMATAAPPDAGEVEKVTREKDRQHHAALSEHKKDIEAMRAELQKLRAEAEMCRAQVAKVPVPPK